MPSKEDLLAALGRLASIAYQRRFVAEATADEYVLPTELIEDVDSTIIRSRWPEARALFDGREREAIEALAAMIDAHSGELLSFASHADAVRKVMTDPLWNDLRAHAEVALNRFGLSTDGRAVEDIEEGDWVAIAANG